MGENERVTPPADQPVLQKRDWKLWDEEHPWVKKLTEARKKRLGKGRKFDDAIHSLFSHDEGGQPFKLPPIPAEHITRNLHQGHGGTLDRDRTPEYENRDLHAEGEWEPRSSASRYGMITFDDHGNVLLRKPTGNYDGYHWTFPKGHPDSPAEHPLDAARRENIEETGHNPAIVGHIAGGFRGGNTSSVNHFYIAHDSKGVVDPSAMSENGETSELRWATPAEALGLISQSTNPGGRYRDLQAYKAATEVYGKLHPEHQFPKINLPVPPKAARAPHGKMFKPSDRRPVRPSYSPPTKKPGVGGYTSGQQNFLAVLKAKETQKKLRDAPKAEQGMLFPEDPLSGGRSDDWSVSEAVDLDTRDWTKWNLDHSHGAKHLNPEQYDKALKDEWAKGNKHALKHIKDDKLSDKEQNRLAMHHETEAAKAEYDHRYLDAAHHRGKASAYTSGKIKKGSIYGKHGAIGGMKGMSKKIAKNMAASLSPTAHMSPMVMLAAVGRSDEELELRNWTKWHHDHPYIPHPRQKNESASEYDKRLKTDYQAWLKDGTARTAGDLKPGDRLHYGNEDHRILGVTPKGSKLNLHMVGETSGKVRTIQAGHTAHAPHANTIAPEREGYHPSETLVPGEHVLHEARTATGKAQHTVLSVNHHGTTGHSLTLKDDRTGEVQTTGVFGPDHSSVVVRTEPKKAPKAPEPKKAEPTKAAAEPVKSHGPYNTPTLTEERRKRMFESEKKDALAKAQKSADKMPTGKGFYEHRKMTDEEYAGHRDHVAYEVERHGGGDLAHSPFSTAVSEDRVNGAEGAYTVERARQQKQIIDEELKKAEKVPNEHRAIIMGGPGGAGKSTILRRNAIDPNSVAGKNGVKYAKYAKEDDPANHIQKGDGIGDPINFVVLNPDNIKTRMAELGMVPTVDHLSPMEAAGPFAHDEASDITQHIADRLTKQGKNVIWDITLNSEKSGQKRVDALRGTPGGYHIDAPFVNVKLTTSAANAEQRHRHGQDDFNMGKGMGGRYVPSDLILGAKDKSGQYDSENRAAFEKLKGAGVFDHTMTIDNEGYKGTLLDESGHPATPEELHMAQRSDEAPSPGRQSETMNLINSYAGGHLSFATLKQLLAHKTYAVPSHMTQADRHSHNSEELDFAEPGTWGEVHRANAHGLLSDDEYDQIHQAMCQAHGAVRTPPVPLSGDMSDDPADHRSAQ